MRHLVLKHAPGVFVLTFVGPAERRLLPSVAVAAVVLWGLRGGAIVRVKTHEAPAFWWCCRLPWLVAAPILAASARP